MEVQFIKGGRGASTGLHEAEAILYFMLTVMYHVEPLTLEQDKLRGGL